jgi:TPR repeat protein
MNGNGVNKDPVEAVKWFRKAGDNGSPGAQVRIGDCYAQGLGVSKDHVEAVKWYRMAAESGDVQAQFRLGMSYSRGEGLPRNDVEAVKWLRKAAASGNPTVLNNLAWLLSTSADAEVRDGRSAVAFAEKAVAGSRRKDPAALDTLAAAYAESGHFSIAISLQEEALALIKSDSDKAEYLLHLELYKTNSPYRSRN